MSKVVNEVVAGNQAYAQAFEPRRASTASSRAFAIFTCMDARLDPAKYAGLAEGDAHVIRNAGGRATDDAVRSLVIPLKPPGSANGSSFITRTAEWSSLPTRSSLISSMTISARLPLMARPGRIRIDKGGHAAGHFIKWHTIRTRSERGPGRAPHS